MSQHGAVRAACQQTVNGGAAGQERGREQTSAHGSAGARKSGQQHGRVDARACAPTHPLPMTSPFCKATGRCVGTTSRTSASIKQRTICEPKPQGACGCSKTKWRCGKQTRCGTASSSKARGLRGGTPKPWRQTTPLKRRRPVSEIREPLPTENLHRGRVCYVVWWDASSEGGGGGNPFIPRPLGVVGSLLPSASADLRFSGDVIVLEGMEQAPGCHHTPLGCWRRRQSHDDVRIPPIPKGGPGERRRAPTLQAGCKAAGLAQQVEPRHGKHGHAEGQGQDVKLVASSKEVLYCDS